MDAARAIADLRELDRLTGGPGGARRVCWTPEWEAARSFLRERLAGLDGVVVELDAACNLWATFAGMSPETVAVGSHLDSVPGGGWLDGALGVMAALEVLRAAAGAGKRPERTVALVDWADEEGARFGHSLVGSSAFAGTLDPGALRSRRDASGVTFADAVAAHGVDPGDMSAAGEGMRGRRGEIVAYLELHIEQGPVLEAEGLACAAVLGCAGVERHRITFTGRTAHAGSTPMDRRSDAAVAAARVVVGLREIGVRYGGVCTAGRLDLEPGVVTAVPGRAELLIDQRHLDAQALAAMLAEARALWAEAAGAEGCAVDAETIWRIDPVLFDERLVSAARRACGEVCGSGGGSGGSGGVGGTRSGRALPSGALHDAAVVARVAPAAMIFSSSIGGISHDAAEDTAEADLEQALEAFGLLARRVIEQGVR